MNPDFSEKQPTRLLPETMKAIDLYRKSVKKQTGKTPSINGAINALIIIGQRATLNAEDKRRIAPGDVELQREKDMNKDGQK